MTSQAAERTNEASGPDGPKRIPVHCPADGHHVGDVPDLGAAEVAEMAAGLRAAQPGWERLGPKGRGVYMLRWLDWILDNEDRIVALLQEETGKSWGDAAFEIVLAVDLIRYYTKHAEEFLADRSVRPHAAAQAQRKIRVQVRPHQLVGMITPWNGPFGAPFMDGVAALMAGAAVMFKPSEMAPLAWGLAARAWHEEIGGPNVIGNATGAGATGAAVVEEADMVMFTGSIATGRKIAARAGERLIPASLELGGKDAMLVCADADVERAAGAAVWGSMFGAGQLCVAVERVYVEAPVYDEFVEKATAKVRSLRQGMDTGASFSADLGSMATEAQLATVERHVDDALAKGARALTGGKRGAEGLFYEPTVLVDVDHSMLCMRDETFGPTLPIMKVADEQEGLRLANDSRYGLSSSVWTKDRVRADRLSREIEAGSVNINNALMSTFQVGAPMGGWKSSGVGTRFGGAAGMLKYCRTQTVVSERVEMTSSEPHWYPHGPRKNKLQARITRFLGARDWRRKLGLAPASPGR